MSALGELPLRHKVYAYILRKGLIQMQLLVFKHVDYPEAGVQVPGGTVEPGEEYSMAVRREVAAETGLEGLFLQRSLGSVQRDMRGLGLVEVHHRHYFLFSCIDCEQEEWVAYEETPSDGSEGPIAFNFFWVDILKPPFLHGGLGEMLSRVV